jgi:hypothetical protein
MMVLGMPGFNAEQNRLHMSLWVMSGAPLIIGADLTKLDDETLRALKNPEAIAIDQDALGLQGVKVKELAPGLEIWSKFLSTIGSRAVLLLNRTYFPAPMAVSWEDLGLKSGSTSVRNVWVGKESATDEGSFHATVPAQDAVLLIVHGSEGSVAHYMPAQQPSGNKDEGFTASQTVFDHVAGTSLPFAPVRILYTNDAPGTEVVGLYVNGETGTRVAFPPTHGTASVWVQARIDHPGESNKLTFDTQAQSGLKIEAMDVY